MCRSFARKISKWRACSGETRESTFLPVLRQRLKDERPGCFASTTGYVDYASVNGGFTQSVSIGQTFCLLPPGDLHTVRIDLAKRLATIAAIPQPKDFAHGSAFMVCS